ncbi:MAG TPA: hypothetical protein VNX01_07275, partial [Bacteroidia bacterium]|nr:hypothetical protein [Bacteroidia bacterium]
MKTKILIPKIIAIIIALYVSNASAKEKYFSFIKTKPNLTSVTSPTIAATASPSTIICSGGLTTLQASGASTYTWSSPYWIVHPTGSSVAVTPSVTTTYTVIGTSALGIQSAPQTIVVTVNSLPSINAGTNVSICSGSNTTLAATGATSYIWSPTTGLSSSTVSNPSANPTTTTIYTVTGTASNGCSNKGQVSVTVNSLPSINAGTNVSICSGSNTTLAATGATSYIWSPATGLSSATVS